jgi:ATP-dependent Lon protease
VTQTTTSKYLSIPPDCLDALPIMALRNSVLFPASVIPVNVGRKRSVHLIETVSGMDRPTIGVLTQHQPETEDPRFDALYPIGAVARILKTIRLSSGNFSVVLQGISRMRVIEPLSSEPYLSARVERLYEKSVRNEEIDALTALVRESARELVELLPQPPHEVGAVLDNVHEAGALADLIASNLPITTEQKQRILETLDLRERLRMVLDLVKRQSAIHRVKQEVATIVQEGITGSQRELLLRQQLKAIRRELGDGESEDDELDALQEKLATAEPPPEVEKAAKRELSRMNSMNPHGSEYQVSYEYVSWLVSIPWKRLTPDRLDVAEVQRVLDEDHHGIEKAKQRILEYMAVRKLRNDKKGPILCFIGPPGVGKSSLGRSIGRALGRKHLVISLGGVQDEAEIRGHRRTYVGALPGRLVSGLKKADARNPVFVLDEIDKMGVSFSGDPAAALLEALDPEQNNAFVDHYLDMPIDLSQVLFIATANQQDKIPHVLLDRMEVIELPGYMRNEKLEIARQFLIPRQFSEHGMTPDHLEISNSAIDYLIDEYTDEAGVRQLEKSIANLCRSVAVRIADGETVHIQADREYIELVNGPPRYQRESAETKLAPGISTSLTWTPSGGELLLVECTKMPGKGTVYFTGQMGSVMRESATTAFTYIRSRAARYHLDDDFLSKIDIHVHLPKGRVPKDGPAVGLSVFVSLLSLLTQREVRPDVAITGEITLRGAILRVDGIKQKCLIAHRSNVRHVIIPKQNEPDLDEVPKLIRDELTVHLVSRIDEVPPLVF